METIIQAFVDNPVYLAVAVILALVIIIGFIRKLMKLVLVVAAILVIYIAYMIFWLDKSPYEIKEELEKIPEKLKETSSQIFYTGKDKIEKTFEEKLDEKVKDLVAPN